MPRISTIVYVVVMLLMSAAWLFVWGLPAGALAAFIGILGLGARDGWRKEQQRWKKAPSRTWQSYCSTWGIIFALALFATILINIDIAHRGWISEEVSARFLHKVPLLSLIAVALILPEAKLQIWALFRRAPKTN